MRHRQPVASSVIEICIIEKKVREETSNKWKNPFDFSSTAPEIGELGNKMPRNYNKQTVFNNLKLFSQSLIFT